MESCYCIVRLFISMNKTECDNLLIVLSCKYFIMHSTVVYINYLINNVKDFICFQFSVSGIADFYMQKLYL